MTDYMTRLTNIAKKSFMGSIPMDLTEKFEEKKEMDTWSVVLFFLFTIPWILTILVLWIMQVKAAFECNVYEGVFALFFMQMYKMFKFSELIKLTCPKKAASIF